MSFSKEPIYGNHLGIVVNKEDPESRGRVQIWIPYLSNTLHAGWNKSLTNKKFKHIHDSGALTPELVEELKNVLPWAECAAPIFGAGTSATYNPSTGITDTNPHRTFTMQDPQQGGYRQGDIGPTSRGGHFDIKAIDKSDFGRTGLDNFVFVNDQPLSSGRTSSGGVWSSPRPGRPRHGGYDYAFGRAGDASDDDDYVLTLANGAKWVGNSGTSSGDKAIFELPDGRRFAILHGRFDPSYGGQDIKTQPADSVAGTFVDKHNQATGAEDKVKDASAPNSSGGISSNLLDFIKDAEAGKDRSSFNATAKNDNGTWTIGYGTESRPGATITEAEASAALARDLAGRAVVVNNELNNRGIQLTQSQREALISYTFNRGPDGLTELLNNSGNSWDSIGPNMPKYFAGRAIRDNPNNPFYAGLKNRRQSELNYANSDGAAGGTPIFSDGDAMTAAVPGFNPIISDPTLAGSQPSGMLSIPEPGAKVFVFFLAGDIQKPIYFANSLEPETVRKLTQSSSLGQDITDQVTHSIATHMRSGSSHIDIVSKQGISLADGVPYSANNVSIGSDGTSMTLTGHQFSAGSAGDYRATARGAMIYEGDIESKKIFSDINQVAGRDFTILAGEQNNEQYEAAKKLAEITSQVQKEKLEQIKSTSRSGEKVPCPLCSTSYAVDRASSFAKRAFSFVRNLIGNPPYFSYVIDVFQFLLGLILVPFTSIVPGHVLGDCGNPDCEKGQIPSPQKPIQDANKEAAEKLASKQDEIFDAEKKLGNGGSCSVVASKDVVISAGMVINDAPCYTKTVKKSVAVATQTKGADGKGQTVCQRFKSAVIDNVVYCAPTNLPGNILLRGGNSVQIVAGAAGIEFNTKGKIKMNCGSIEILSSDGEMVVGSTNHTTIKGKVVTISGDDRTNEGGVEIQAPNMICKGFSSTGNAGIVGGLRVDGELSIPFLNCVGQRTQTEQGASPDQRIPFTNWGYGPAQTNDLLNNVRTVLTHYAMPGAFLNLTNVVKAVMQVYNTIYINTVIEPAPTGLYLGFCANAAGPGISWGWIWNWHHNHLEDPKPHHHDCTQPKGNYYDDIQGVRNSAVEPGPIPTKARSNGQGPDGGPKTLAGCGGFGGWGGGSGGKRFNYNKMNSFGIGDQVPGFTNTRLQSSNIKFKRQPDGNIDIIVDNTKC
jgi:GH24 family phage-related lysozyme (muramidase)